MIRGFVNTKMPEGSSVSAHLFKMQGYLQELQRMEVPMANIVVTDLILNSLPASYTQFVQNYHMMKWDKSLEELQGMLKTYEADSKKNKPQEQVLAVAEKKITKKKKNKKGKGKAPVENGSKDKKDSLANVECFYCKGKGH